ncbi:MAG: hypothetical protein KF903_00365 [Dokdonella sp.]|uniref:hypothetical protein n=1 Tax=Dokdonella sp. TaxID=2291710 RepID=UPI0025BB2123|nr:hypothetical protein [Dokdonella sp.]MBX3699449.1 hypothetical protein [Dokdonella sp.]
MSIHDDGQDSPRVPAGRGGRHMSERGPALDAPGHAHCTRDIDAWFGGRLGNAGRWVAAPRDSAFGHIEVPLPDLGKPRAMPATGAEPNTIELRAPARGVAFDDRFARGGDIAPGQVVAPLIARDDVIGNQRATGRLRDLADIEMLQAP